MPSADDAGTFTLGGMTVARLGYGSMRITGPGTFGPPPDRAECIRVLRRAVELGVTFIDTADSYGPDVSEEIIAEALHPYPAGLVIGTKGGFVRPGPGDWRIDCDPARLRSALDGSLRRLRVERIDLWQLHRVDTKVPAEEQYALLAEFVASGKVRAVGLSEVTVEQIEAARAHVPIVSVQNRYNLFDRDWESVLDHCAANGIAFIPWYPLSAGKANDGKPAARAMKAVADRHSASPMQIALAWLLARSPVMLPIPGTSQVRHLEENVAAASIVLTAADLAELDPAPAAT